MTLFCACVLAFAVSINIGGLHLITLAWAALAVALLSGPTADVARVFAMEHGDGH